MVVEALSDVFRNTLMITCFVLVIMLFIELLNLLTQGRWSRWLNRFQSLQIVIAAFLGLIPGCFGGFAVVGMWTHGVLSFGALVAAMISSVGDEAFVMLVRMPGKSLFLFALLLVLGWCVGRAIDVLGIRIQPPGNMKNHLVVHENEVCLHDLFRGWKTNFRKPTGVRMLLIGGLLLFIGGMVTGFFEHDVHEGMVGSFETSVNAAFNPFLVEGWFNGFFLFLAIAVLVVMVFISDHFLKEHFWKHIVRQHVPKIFWWTFGALLLIHLFMDSVDVASWVEKNRFWVLLLAVLFGFIPESGPHLVFVSLFVSGILPFSVLMANSVIQDGHSTLPLLAESKKGFFAVKMINALVGLAVGLTGILLDF